MTNLYRNNSVMKINSLSGQGLIETLLVLLLVGIAVVSLMRYQHNTAYRADNAQQQFDAMLLAQNRIEILRDFQVLTTTSGYVAYTSIVTGSTTSTVGNTAYTIAWTITTTASPSYKRIDVTVSWTNRVGTAQSVRLITIVAGIDPATSASVI